MGQHVTSLLCLHGTKCILQLCFVVFVAIHYRRKCVMHSYADTYNYHCCHIEFKPNIFTYKNVKTNNVHKIYINLYITIECVGISNHQE
jgi:hypothetical protein